MQKDGDATPPESMYFPEERIADAEQPWLTLLETGNLPTTTPDQIPTSYMVSEKWLPRLKTCAEQSGSWNALLHYGTAVYEYQNNRVYVTDSYDEEQEAEQLAQAHRAWEASAEKMPNVWALRNLAILAERKDDKEGAEALYDKALALPEALCDYALVSEYLGFLGRLKKHEKVWQIFNTLPSEYQMVDRIQISAAVAAVRLGEFDYLEGFFKRKHHDIREGEESLTDIWFTYSAYKLAAERGIVDPNGETLDRLIDEAWDRCPPPEDIDFRMSLDRENRYRI
jgi:tetratricopeptide (TPR) repeat protein